MTGNPGLERAIEGIELVRGIGDPAVGRLCVMSFVAYLAGECHTDRPRCASPVIRSMAVIINDQMPPATRQRLKAFAPRIIGTNDGHDAARAEILSRAMFDELLPAACHDAQAVRSAGRKRSIFGRLWTEASKRSLAGRMAKVLSELKAEQENGVPSELEEQVGQTTGHLITLLARDAPTADGEMRYWDMAIALIDQLCDVGAESRAWGVVDERLARLGHVVHDHRSFGDAWALGPLPFDFASPFSGCATTHSGQIG
jgi:hypothetical protein